MRLPDRLGVNEGARSLRTDDDRIDRRSLGSDTTGGGGSSCSSCIGVSGRRPGERGLPEVLDRGEATGDELVRIRGDGGEPINDRVAAARIGSSLEPPDGLRRRAWSLDAGEGVTSRMGTMGRSECVRCRRCAAMTDGDASCDGDR